MKDLGYLSNIIIAPIVTEKTQRSMSDGNYIAFKVGVHASKRDVADAIKALFDAKVEAVNILKCKGKTKRFGNMEGKRQTFKKAYVKLAEGTELNFN